MTAKMQTGVLAFLLLVNATITNSAFAEDDTCIDSIEVGDFPSKIEIETDSTQYTGYFSIAKADSLINLKLNAFYEKAKVDVNGDYCVELYARTKSCLGSEKDTPAGSRKCTSIGTELFHQWSKLGIGTYRIKIWKRANDEFMMKGSGTAEKF
jgi:hypothetical protein